MMKPLRQRVLDLCEYFYRNRGAGHTTVLVEAVANHPKGERTPVLIVNKMMNVGNLHKDAKENVFAFEDPDLERKLQGRHGPMVVDHFVLTTLLRDYVRKEDLLIKFWIGERGGMSILRGDSLYHGLAVHFSYYLNGKKVENCVAINTYTKTLTIRTPNVRSHPEEPSFHYSTIPYKDEMLTIEFTV